MTPGFDHSYAGLGSAFSTAQAPDPVSAPQILLWNASLAEALGWSGTPDTHPEQLQALAGNQPLPDTQPIATVYAGHQFGQYNPQLGDGRATLLGEWVTASGDRFDIQLKVPGPAPIRVVVTAALLSGPLSASMWYPRRTCVRCSTTRFGRSCNR